MTAAETSTDTTADPSAVQVTVLKAALPEQNLTNDLLRSPTQTSDTFEIPPLPPAALMTLVERSGILGPPISAYVTNIDSQGHRIVPALNLMSPGVEVAIADLMFVGGLVAAQERGEALNAVPEPSPEETEAKLRELRRRVRLEQAQAASFFASCNPEGSFNDLRRETRRDLEKTGNAYWEVLRNGGRPTTVIRVPAISMRIGKGPLAEVRIRARRQVTPLLWETYNARRTFKRFVQVDTSETPRVWFKEFGDPRVMSRASGTYYESVARMQAAERGAEEATEILHYEIPSGMSVYGMPRWAGNLPAVLGSRELDEVNLDYFKSNAVPALAILIAGGVLSAQQHERLKEFFEEEVRGPGSHAKAIVLEALSQKRSATDGPSPVPKIDFVPLRAAQQKDALFQVYDKRNVEKVSADFRLPISITTGGNPTEQEKRLAEEQVYQPERMAFDDKINKFLMPALGFELVTFRSNSAFVRDPQAIGELAIEGAKVGILVPDEAREVMESVFDREFPSIGSVWAKQPIPLTLAALGVAGSPAEAVREQGRQGDGGKTPQAQTRDKLLQDLGLVPHDATDGSESAEPPEEPPPPLVLPTLNNEAS